MQLYSCWWYTTNSSANKFGMFCCCSLHNEQHLNDCLHEELGRQESGLVFLNQDTKAQGDSLEWPCYHLKLFTAVAASPWMRRAVSPPSLAWFNSYMVFNTQLWCPPLPASRLPWCSFFLYSLKHPLKCAYTASSLNEQCVLLLHILTYIARSQTPPALPSVLRALPTSPRNTLSV